MKKLCALALALILCLGLTVPALADGMPSIEQAIKLIDWTSSLTEDNDRDMADFQVPGEIHLHPVDENTPDTLPNYCAVGKDDVYTVKHLGTKDDGSYVFVTGYVYELGQDGVYGTDGGISNELHQIKNRGLILWEEGLEETDYVQLHAGESATFKLPTNYPEMYGGGAVDLKNALYHVQVCIYYPKYESGYLIQNYFKIDPDTVAKVLATPKETTTGFTDVPANSPYLEAIKWAVDKNITKGTTSTTFSPNSQCTINHILTFLWRANGKPGAGSNERASVLAWAKTKGITFAETDVPCTRSNAVMCMWKAAGSPAPKTTASFKDVKANADYAKAVSWAVEKGITTGTTKTTFGPDDFCTRGQIVTFLYRASK